jgi:hypothetical protein
LRPYAAVVLSFSIVGGCFKTLDESLLDETKSDAGKTGGSGGTGGDASTGGGGGVGGLTDGAVEAQVVVPYDSSKYPVTNLANGTATVVLAADDTNVFRTTKDQVDAMLIAQPLTSGSGTPLSPTLQRPQALLAPPSSVYVYAVGGNNTTSAGSMVRIPKADGPLETISTGSTAIELVVGIANGGDNYGYVSLKGVNAGAPSVMRFPLANTSPAEVLYTSTTPNESGGDIAVAGGCVYWISNGVVWQTPIGGGERKSATSGVIADAIGITTDSSSFYYTRGDGSVWQRELSSNACDGSQPTEIKVAGGFPGIGDLVRYGAFLTWVAMGDAGDFSGGGVYKWPVAGGDIVQIAPSDDGPVGIDQGKDDIVYSTSTFGLRKVPKVAQ